MDAETFSYTITIRAIRENPGGADQPDVAESDRIFGSPHDLREIVHFASSMPERGFVVDVRFSVKPYELDGFCRDYAPHTTLAVVHEDVWNCIRAKLLG